MKSNTPKPSGNVKIHIARNFGGFIPIPRPTIGLEGSINSALRKAPEDIPDSIRY